jgi:prolyl-tRNA synthetase
MKLSNLFTKTSKTVPADETSKNAQLLIKAGYVHKTMAGVYSYLPLGLRVLNNVENIVRKHMNSIGGQEVLMNALHPKEWWQQAGRWDSVDILFKIDSQTQSEYALACSHEEQVVPVVSSFLASYKDLPDYNKDQGQYPVSVYQIQTKFRDELRAKSGLLRGREFRMKDMYDFHTNSESQDEYYELVKQTYLNVYQDLGMEAYAVEASGGIFTTNLSHEFQTPCEAGEDWIYKDPISGKVYNAEVAPVQAPTVDFSQEEEKDLQHVELPNVIGVKDLCEKLGISPERTTKTLLYQDSQHNLYAAVVRGDRSVNEEKLQNIAQTYLILAEEHLVEARTGAKLGYAGVYDLPENIRVYFDHSVKDLKNFETGTNKTGFHSINVVFGRDVEYPEEFYDISEVQEGDKNPDTQAEYEVIKSAEVGNIFKLDDKYTKAFGVTFTNKNNDLVIPLMNCHGIGTSRSMAVIAENNSDEKGLIWPESVAPFKYHLVYSINKKDEEAIQNKITETVETVYARLGGDSFNTRVVIDDREDASLGEKLKDADLIGCPFQLVVTKRSLEKGGIEMIIRATGESKIITIEDIV